MKISAKARYAVRLLLDIATHQDDGPVRTAELAQHTGVSMRFIEQILQPLKRAGLVRSIRGVSGGYLLAADPAEISLARVVRVIEGGLSLTLCTENPGCCERSIDCASHKAWARATQAMERELEATSIADLRDEAKTSSATPQPKD